MVIEQVCLPKEPVPNDAAELASPPPYLLRRVGRLRVPLAGPYSPWATLYRFPDGRALWVLRLWDVDRPVRRCVSTATLKRYAVSSVLPALVEEIDRLLRTTGAADADPA